MFSGAKKYILDESASYSFCLTFSSATEEIIIVEKEEVGDLLDRQLIFVSLAKGVHCVGC
jgi:hypothetical protein